MLSRKPYEAPKVLDVKPCGCHFPEVDPPPGHTWTHSPECPFADLFERDTIPAPPLPPDDAE